MLVRNRKLLRFNTPAYSYLGSNLYVCILHAADITVNQALFTIDYLFMFPLERDNNPPL